MKEIQRCSETYSILCTTIIDDLAGAGNDSQFSDIYATPGTLALEVCVFRTADKFSFLKTIL